MSDDTTTQSASTKSTSPHLSWQGLELHFDNLADAVFLLMLMTPSILSLASDMAIGRYVAQRAGIGINAGRIRGINSKIRGGEVQHTGVVPFLKKFEATVRCCTQNGIRGGSATVHFPIWHQEIEDIIVLKNNKGTEDNRVRKLDYSIQISKLFLRTFHCGCRGKASSHRMTRQVSMMLLALISLTTYMLVTNEMSLFLEKLSGRRN